MAVSIATLCFGLMLLGSCGGGGGGSGSDSAPASLSGTWSIDFTTLDATTCNTRVGRTRTYVVQLSEDGSLLRIRSPDGVDLAGTLSGSRLSLSGTWPIDGGLTRVLSSDLQLDGDRIRGEVVWEWNAAGQPPCAGRDLFDARRSGASAELSGSWDLQETVLNASCNLSTRFFIDTWTVTQDGLQLRVTRQASGSTATGTLQPDGSARFDFFFDDVNGRPVVEQMTVQFITTRNPPALEGFNAFQLPGCFGQSELLGQRRSP